MNVSVEPLEAHKEGKNQYCAVPGYTFLKPGSDRLKVMIKNLIARTIKVSQGSKVASMEAANVVPHIVAPQDTTPVRPETNIMKSTNVEVSQRDLPMTNYNPKETGQNTHDRGTTSMSADDVDPSEDHIEVVTSKSEVDRMPLTPEQMKQ